MKPARNSQSVSGDFYVCENECISCGAPHAVAPDLIGWAGPDERSCVWKKQPTTSAELEQAFAAFGASCVGAYRYAGTDPAIISRLGPDYCDIRIKRPLAAPSTKIPSNDFALSASNRTWWERAIAAVAAYCVRG